MKRAQVILLALALAAISLIGAGVYLIHPPSALIVVGSLLWLDLMRLTARAGGKP